MTSIPRMASNELAIAPVIVLLMFLRVDGHAHPGMDAALKFDGRTADHRPIYRSVGTRPGSAGEH